MEDFEPGHVSDGDLEALTAQLMRSGDSEVLLDQRHLKKLVREPSKRPIDTPMYSKDKLNDPDSLIEISVSLPLWIVMELEEICDDLGLSISEVVTQAMGVTSIWPIPGWLMILRKEAVRISLQEKNY